MHDEVRGATVRAVQQGRQYKTVQYLRQRRQRRTHARLMWTSRQETWKRPLFFYYYFPLSFFCVAEEALLFLSSHLLLIPRLGLSSFVAVGWTAAGEEALIASCPWTKKYTHTHTLSSRSSSTACGNNGFVRNTLVSRRCAPSFSSPTFHSSLGELRRQTEDSSKKYDAMQSGSHVIRVYPLVAPLFSLFLFRKKKRPHVRSCQG